MTRLISILTTAACMIPIASATPSTMLWYEQPAEVWIQALPVGNGRLGAMVFGEPNQERIQFNEDTRWSGGPYQPDVAGGAEHLGEIRDAIFSNEYRKAHKLFGRHLMGSPIEQQKYQSFGDVILDFGEGETDNYRRELNLDTAIATTSFSRDGVAFTREVFSSPIDQVIVVRITSDTPGSISFKAELRGIRNTQHSNYGNDVFQMDGLPNKRLRLHGKSADYLGVEGAQRYEAQMEARLEGGTSEIVEDNLIVSGADSVTLFLAANTNFKSYKELGADPRGLVEATLTKLAERSFDEIRAEHITEHQRLFHRLSVDLWDGPGASLPTDQRLANNPSKDDPGLASLILQFGRYLLITSSRPGTQPPNLQGIWNEEMNPKWDSKYTININTQMNYWPAEPANLSECTAPLFTMVGELAENGERLAKELYGCEGWVAHQNTDIWRAAAPMDGANWGAFTVGGAWLGTHIWEHYLYNPDPEFLKSQYPVMKGAAEFFLSYLVPHPETGLLVTCPSTSPENIPGHPNNQGFYDDNAAYLTTGTTLCAGATIDQQIIRDVFTQVAEASEVLGIDEDFREKILDARSRLAPTKVGANGELQEWLEDWAQTEESHRHISHLYGLFPGHQITPEGTPELAKGAAAVLEQRGLFGNGWASAWKAACWARLRQPEKAIAHFDRCLEEYTCPNLFSICSGSVQVDGSFGFTATIIEMLMQSHGGEIRLLPALPERWPSGEIKGLRARGGFDIDLKWDESKLTEAKILSRSGELLTIRTTQPLHVFSGSDILLAILPEGLAELPTQAGTTFYIRPAKPENLDPERKIRIHSGTSKPE
ncbi:MAG: glycoside hydrolase family 95 protein [Akkermansiaceae bacterium]|jgi:alpha-L-fucosidase 2|nr:glycoside hydrolase family 95 protein [Akkermansiaceae bacterium]MDP4647796.1 glycoside hydrolase family 95 protein [Akkermansiaceae bacterium]MDP4719624.1 glycoside hydrolase family 95 protein [Akkermansiaceae bacterium]MDP4780871.1 glycoside hydrolase family 95 protein [Akkermansiaceae bacterium]MDP4848587.1 glycoside hydrolase family 95 protein [Akkermansiaceae bacterium]